MTAITHEKQAQHYPVVVVGAGPVGMTLALDLARRGTRVLVLESSAATTTNPRCNTTNARSMEYFRRLGIADTIRRAGLPADHATDVVYCTSLTGYELTRFPFSSSAEVMAKTAHEFADWPTPEPQHRISQIFLEPILEQALLTSPNAELRRQNTVMTVTQDDEVATLTVQHSNGHTETLTADYVVGCDGGASTVRRSIGARLEGDGEASERRHSVYFRSTELHKRLGDRAGWMYWWFGPRYRGSLLQLDGESLFLCHSRVPRGTDPDDMDTDEVLVEAIGTEIEHEQLDVVRWTARRLVADRFRDRRILLAGDAAHLWLPLGGFGMNTGIADAIALSWRLDAVLNDWAGDRVLDDFAAERRSIGEATSQAALKIDVDMNDVARDPVLHEDTPEGAELRGKVGDLIQQVDRQQWFSQGVQFGARYIGSPGIAGDGTASGAIEAIDEYRPSIEPGARVPHLWLPDGSSLFDHIGDHFTLMRIGDAAPSADAFVAAAEELGVPLRVVVLDGPIKEPVYEHPTLVLVRPDQVVAWSGAAMPEDARSVFGGIGVNWPHRPAENRTRPETRGEAVPVPGRTRPGTGASSTRCRPNLERPGRHSLRRQATHRTPRRSGGVRRRISRKWSRQRQDTHKTEDIRYLRCYRGRMLKERPLIRAGDASLFVAHRRELDHAIASVARGLNVVLSGAPGSGKSSLLAQLATAEHANQHMVYAAGADSAATLIEAIAEDVVGPVSRRQDKFESLSANMFGKLETTPTTRGRIVSSIDRIANYLERDLDSTMMTPQPIILVDHVARKSAQELFKVYADLLAKIDAIWVVCVQGAVIGGPTNPASNFFDVHLHLGPPSLADGAAVVASRTSLSLETIKSRLAAASADPMELRSLVAFARQLDAGIPVGDGAFEDSRRAAQARLSALGRPAAMLVAEMQHLGPVSPSDERLLERMGWKRARASEMLSKLGKAELVRFTEQAGPEGGRPRRVYELIPELQS